MFHIILAALLLIGGIASAQSECAGQTACSLGDREYHLRAPDDWDGTTPLPVLLHFHGWGRNGGIVVDHSRIAILDVADRVLMIAPSGLGGSWSFRRPGSPDTAFAEAVIEDVAQRFPIDRDRIFVSGYSWGANMAWRFTCESETPVAGLLAVAGTLPQSEACTQAPGELRQVYGLTDTVLPYPMGPDGDETYPVALWREALECGDGMDAGEWNARPFLTFTRTI
ncbi:MAG: polyhydroxybutyrate depolymerase [Rhodobacteraceae bacterium]|nr:polyhydroxybutyrate depolymerase [Paracoccaceae bacterium]